MFKVKTAGKILALFVVLMLACTVLMSGLASAGKVGTTTCPGCAHVSGSCSMGMDSTAGCKCPGCPNCPGCKCPGCKPGTA